MKIVFEISIVHDDFPSAKRNSPDECEQLPDLVVAHVAQDVPEPFDVPVDPQQIALERMFLNFYCEINIFATKLNFANGNLFVLHQNVRNLQNYQKSNFRVCDFQI